MVPIGRANLIRAELSTRRRHRIGDVLNDLESQTDERAQDEPVERGSDLPLRQRDEQQQARTFRQLFGERGRQPGTPVQRPHLAEGLAYKARIASLALAAIAPVAAKPPHKKATTMSLCGSLA